MSMVWSGDPETRLSAEEFLGLVLKRQMRENAIEHALAHGGQVITTPLGRLSPGELALLYQKCRRWIWRVADAGRRGAAPRFGGYRRRRSE